MKAVSESEIGAEDRGDCQTKYEALRIALRRWLDKRKETEDGCFKE